MNARGLWQVSLVTILLAAAGCYRPFSPEQVRREIEHQTGAEPRSSFEFKQKVLRATGLQGLKEHILAAAGENPTDTAPPGSSKQAP